MSKKYQIIYADPPWSYRAWNENGTGRHAQQHYKTMTRKEIQALRVKDIADDNCILFLWATFPCIEEALELIKAWGFTYKTIGFNWVKFNKRAGTWFWGHGHYTRSNSEICLIATRGKIKRISSSVHQIVCTRVEGHSKKPNIVRNRIVELCGDLPRVELFAREHAGGLGRLGRRSSVGY